MLALTVTPRYFVYCTNWSRCPSTWILGGRSMLKRPFSIIASVFVVEMDTPVLAPHWLTHANAFSAATSSLARLFSQIINRISFAYATCLMLLSLRVCCRSPITMFHIAGPQMLSCGQPLFTSLHRTSRRPRMHDLRFEKYDLQSAVSGQFQSCRFWMIEPQFR